VHAYKKNVRHNNFTGHAYMHLTISMCERDELIVRIRKRKEKESRSPYRALEKT
jgi:hypothetical protein